MIRGCTLVLAPKNISYYFAISNEKHIFLKNLFATAW